MKSKAKDPHEDPYKREQNSKTNIGYDNTPKKAKDTKGEDAKPDEEASVDFTQQLKQQRYEDPSRH